MSFSPKCVVRALNDTFFNEDGSSHIDMFAANGTVLLGHGNPGVTAELKRQMDLVWNTGTLDTPARLRARELIESFFPDSHRIVALYSTGMESAEFAIRLSRVATRRPGLIGFSKSMHGKSLATAFLAWENPYMESLSGFHRLPYPTAEIQEAVLGDIERLLSSRTIAAVFLEPIQGTAGGHAVTPAFAAAIRRLCDAHGTLLLFDEILAGFYRTGTAFVHQYLGVTPDIILVGKIIGNGFPVSAVVARKDYSIEPAMLPGSTYAGNPLAAAAVVGTLMTMKNMDIAERVAFIDGEVRARLSTVDPSAAVLRGRGAFWVLEFKDSAQAEALATSAYEQGVLLGRAGTIVRLMPPATIVPDNLAHALDVVTERLGLAPA